MHASAEYSTRTPKKDSSFLKHAETENKKKNKGKKYLSFQPSSFSQTTSQLEYTEGAGRDEGVKGRKGGMNKSKIEGKNEG